MKSNCVRSELMTIKFSGFRSLINLRILITRTNNEAAGEEKIDEPTCLRVQ